MSHTTAPTLLVVEAQTGECARLYEQLREPSRLPQALNVVTVKGAKKGRKRLRKLEDVVTVLVVVDASAVAQVQELLRVVREVIRDTTMPIVVYQQVDTGVSASAWIREHSANAVVNASQGGDELCAQLWSQISVHHQFARLRRQHLAETDLLTALARFSRMELELTDCLEEFARSSGLISGALLANVVLVNRDSHLARTSVMYIHQRVPAEAARALISDNFTPTSELLLQTVTEGRLQLTIDQDEDFNREASMALGEVVAGRFAFPLRSFGRVMSVVECFLPANALDTVSVDLVRVIEKSGEQLSVLFERKEAETQLKTQYERLKHTLEELSNTREALIHSEKLASIGQLAAGIAHEINNPIGYVLSNFEPLNEYVDGMTQMLSLHGRFVEAIDASQGDTGVVPLRSDLDEMEQALDMNFVLEDVRALVSESREGLNRVIEIVRNLNEFARKDDVECAPNDINEALEATLKILPKAFAGEVQITLDLSDLPPVSCNIGLVKQVFLNLMSNACQAMDGKGAVEVSSRLVGPMIRVAVRDNGPGIPQDVLNRIFEPFFTTKEVGKGTGLGLSLCHGIVTRHGGTLVVASTGPDGSEFHLTLPVAGPDTKVDGPALSQTA